MKIFLTIVLSCFAVVAFPQQKPNADAVRDVYTFDYAYELEVEVNGQKLEMTYHIKPGADYFGHSMKLIPTAFEVSDIGRKLIFKSLGKAAKVLPLEDGKKGPVSSRHQYTKLPDKNILGYHCIGVKAESDTEIAILYFTNEAEAAYLELYKKLRVHQFVLRMADYGFTEKSLLMLSDITRKKDNGHAVIACTGFEKQPKTIRKADYKIADNF